MNSIQGGAESANSNQGGKTIEERRPQSQNGGLAFLIINRRGK